MNLDNFKDRLKPTGVLYIDLYPYYLGDDGSIELLILKRNESVQMPQTWQTISGKIKKDETIAQAFWRQAQQKTGMKPSRIFKLDYVNTFYDNYYDTVMLVPVAACQMPSKEIDISDLHTEYKWVSNKEIENFLIWPNQLESVKLAVNMIKNPNLISKFHLL